MTFEAGAIAALSALHRPSHDIAASALDGRSAPDVEAACLVTAPPIMDGITGLTAAALSRAIAARAVSCREVASAYLARIERLNPGLNAIVSLRDPDAILAEARVKDDLLARGERQGWMHGFPHAVKDLAATKGLRTTQGSLLHRDMVPDRDALFVRRMRAAGAIVIGKTNTAEFGLGSQTYNGVFGITRNARDRTRTAGGSSGGAAVAVAARMVPVADGSDHAGSLRNPAAYNGVYALRPTPGCVPAEGRDTCLPALGVVGPMARTVEDLALLLAVQAGYDPSSPGASRDDPDRFRASLERDPRGLRLGWLGDLDGYLACEPGVIALCERALATFSALGCHVEPARLRHAPEDVWSAWTVLRAWLTGGALADRYRDPAKRALMKPEACWEVEQALALSALDVFDASTRRAAWCRSLARLFEAFDALVLPSAQCFPFAAQTPWPRQIAGRTMDTYHRWMEVAIFATMAGCPTINVPAGLSADGLPMGLQIIAPPHADLACLQIARAFEAATDGGGPRSPATFGN